MGYEKIKYNGNALSITDQLELLKERGLIIQDEHFAKQCVLFTGFYRFFSYAKPLLNSNNSKVDFEDAWSLYVFDRKLRLLVNDAIERIEVAFRVSISEEMSPQHNPFWYLKSELFANTRHHLDFIEQIIKLQKSRKNPLIKHYYETYCDPEFPPSWIIIECLTFGTWSKVFYNLKNRCDKKIISSRLGQSFKTLESWIVSLIEIRNICAHHERLWNRNFHYPPRNAPNEIHQNGKFYQQAFIIIQLLKTISPSSDWKNNLFNLLQEYKHLPIKKMGFISNWEKDQFWQI